MLRERLDAAAGRPAPVRRRQGGHRLPAPGRRCGTHLRDMLEAVSTRPRRTSSIAWVLDFPSFIWDDEEKRWAANHHPFTAPQDEDLRQLESDPGRVQAKAYDLVINGYECGGGSIRIHNPDVQSRLFRVLGMSDGAGAGSASASCSTRCKFGAPPHGGIALGLDRLAMMLAGTTNIRDVIAFPKNQQARDLMTGAPPGRCEATSRARAAQSRAGHGAASMRPGSPQDCAKATCTAQG